MLYSPTAGQDLTGELYIPGREHESDSEDDAEATDAERSFSVVAQYEDGARTMSPRSEFNLGALDFTNIRRLVTNPVPRAAGIVQCYIRRDKSGANKLYPEYRLYMKVGDRFLLNSKKRSQNKVRCWFVKLLALVFLEWSRAESVALQTSNYLISSADGDFEKTSPNYVGKLRSNFIGTEFQIYDHGLNPR